MIKLMIIACTIYILIPATIGYCNLFPLIFGSINAATNITVVEFSAAEKQLWVGGATYDDKFAGGAGLSGGI